MVNHTILDKYTERFDEELYRLTNERYRKVPTGVFIESYETTAFEAKLIGKLWMKYPKELIERRRRRSISRTCRHWSHAA